MKIAFDYQIFSLQPYGGITRYFVRLAQELVANGENLRIVAPVNCNRYLSELPSSNIEGLDVHFLPHKLIRLIAPVNRSLCTRGLKHFEPNVLHETYYSRKPILISGAARVTTVHDMIHERFPESFSKFDKTSQFKRAAVERADHIICVSHNTKRDLCEMFGVSPERVSVVHLGFERFTTVEHQAQRTPTDRPFVLFVGNRRGYKNFEGTLRAIASRHELSEEVDIIAFGGGSFSHAELKLIHNLGLRPNSVLQSSGDDTVLGQLYRNASAFVCPSHYEGFGLPALEAMAHGCPVVTSNTGSLPEVVDRAGEYFAPGDIEAQAQAISNVVYNASRRDELIQAGQKRLNSFSWSQCAEQTRRVYESI